MARHIPFVYPFESAARVQDFAHALAFHYFERHRNRHVVYSIGDSRYSVVDAAVGLAGNFGAKVEAKRTMTFHQQMHCCWRGRGGWRAYLAARDAGTLPLGLPSMPVLHDWEQPVIRAGDWKMRFELRYPPELRQVGWNLGDDPGPDDTLLLELVAVWDGPVEQLRGARRQGRLWNPDEVWNPAADHPDMLIPTVEAAVGYYAAELAKLTVATGEE